MQLGQAGAAAPLSSFHYFFLEHKTKEAQEGTGAAATEGADSGCGGERPAKSQEEGGFQMEWGLWERGAGNDAFLAMCRSTEQTQSAHGLI